MVWRIYDKDCFHIRALTATTAKCKWKYHGTSPAATPTDGITNCAINNIINGRRARWTQKFQKRVGKSKPTLMKIAKSQRPDLFALECLYYWWCPIRHTWIWYATHEERLTQCQLSSSISFLYLKMPFIILTNQTGHYCARRARGGRCCWVWFDMQLRTVPAMMVGRGEQSSEIPNFSFYYTEFSLYDYFHWNVSYDD